MRPVDLVFRSVGERTASISLEFAIRNIQPNKVFHINAIRPFALAVEEMLKIKHDAEYIVYVDADCIIAEDLRDFLEFVKWPFVDCIVDDYFRGKVSAGVHIVRADLKEAMQRSIKTVSQNEHFLLRPESALRNFVMKSMEMYKVYKKFNIFHYFQSYEDIFYKYGIRELRDRSDKNNQLNESMKCWGSEPEFDVARAAISYTRAKVRSDYTFDEISSFIEKWHQFSSKQAQQLNYQHQRTLESGHVNSKINQIFSNEKKFNSKSKVLGIGLCRTATNRLGRALNILGVESIHQPFYEGMAEELFNGNHKLSVLDFYDGITGITTVPYYKKLDSEYPGSKFILTIRDIDFWLDSIRSQLKKETNNSENISKDKKIRLEFRKTLRNKVFGIQNYQTITFLNCYEKHVADVVSHFSDRPDDLLIMNIYAGDGWNKLCPFLDIEKPDTPFPFTRRQEKGMYLLRKKFSRGINPISSASIQSKIKARSCNGRSVRCRSILWCPPPTGFLDGRVPKKPRIDLTAVVQR